MNNDHLPLCKRNYPPLPRHSAERPPFLVLDVLDAHSGRFIGTFRYPVPAKKGRTTITGRQLMGFVYVQRPSLRRRHIIFGLGPANIDPGTFAEIQIVFDSTHQQKN